MNQKLNFLSLDYKSCKNTINLPNNGNYKNIHSASFSQITDNDDDLVLY